MKRYVAILLLGMVSNKAHGQQADCYQPEMSSKQLSEWMSKAQSKAERASLVCYLHREEAHYKALAGKEEAALAYAYDHPIGSSKYPSAAAHARTFKALYEESAARYAHLAEQLEKQERKRDEPAS